MGQCHLHIQQWNLSRVHTCFDVNALWVEAVLSLNEKRTFDFLFSHIHEETIKDMSRLAIGHLKAGNCDVGAHCLEEYIRNNQDI